VPSSQCLQPAKAIKATSISIGRVDPPCWLSCSEASIAAQSAHHQSLTFISPLLSSYHRSPINLYSKNQTRSNIQLESSRCLNPTSRTSPSPLSLLHRMKRSSLVELEPGLGLSTRATMRTPPYSGESILSHITATGYGDSSK